MNVKGNLGAAEDQSKSLVWLHAGHFLVRESSANHGEYRLSNFHQRSLRIEVGNNNQSNQGSKEKVKGKQGKVVKIFLGAKRKGDKRKKK
jgi:hypothetical protein